MSSQHFKITHHTIPASRIRQSPLATISGREESLYLAVNQYTPLSNLEPQEGDVTVIGAHANGFPKVYLTPTKLTLITHVQPLIGWIANMSAMIGTLRAAVG